DRRAETPPAVLFFMPIVQNDCGPAGGRLESDGCATRFGGRSFRRSERRAAVDPLPDRDLLPFRAERTVGLLGPRPRFRHVPPDHARPLLSRSRRPGAAGMAY